MSVQISAQTDFDRNLPMQGVIHDSRDLCDFYHSATRIEMKLSVLEAAVPNLLPVYHARRWKAMFGVSLSATESLWNLPEVHCSSLHLLWFLYYVKVYPTDSLAAAWAGCDEKTWRKQLRLVASCLNTALPPVRYPLLRKTT